MPRRLRQTKRHSFFQKALQSPGLRRFFSRRHENRNGLALMTAIDACHGRAKPMRSERSGGPSKVPARFMNGLVFACRARSIASFTKLPRERPAALACSSTQRANSSGNRILSVVLIRQDCVGRRSSPQALLSFLVAKLRLRNALGREAPLPRRGCLRGRPAKLDALVPKLHLEYSGF